MQALSQQLTDTKSVYARSRDQLRADSSALEAAKNAALQEIRRLGEEKAELRAASQKQLAGGDTAGHAALRSQEARLDDGSVE